MDTDRRSGKPFDVPGGTATVRLRLEPQDGECEHRITAWREAIGATAELRLSQVEVGAFSAAMTAWRFGALMAVHVTCSNQRLLRSRAMAASLPLDHVLINTVVAGCVTGRLGRRRVVTEPGGVSVQRLASPMDVRMEDATWLGLIVPLSSWEAGVGSFVPSEGWSFAPAPVEATLVGGLLRSLTTLPDRLDAMEGAKIVRVSMALLRKTLGDGEGPDEEGRSVAIPLDRMVRRYIEANLPDPTLDANAICRRFALSRSGLHRLLGPGLSEVARTIRRLRLLETHREIAALKSENCSLAMIAARWGLSNERSFRRAFVREFGYAPADLRRRVRSGEGSVAPTAGSEFERWFQGWAPSTSSPRVSDASSHGAE